MKQDITKILQNWQINRTDTGQNLQRTELINDIMTQLITDTGQKLNITEMTQDKIDTRQN